MRSPLKLLLLLLQLLLVLVLLATLPKTTESLSDRPVSTVAPALAKAIATANDNRIAEMASFQPGDVDADANDIASLVQDPLPEMPLLPITSEDTVRACRELKVSSKDVFVCSYPKSGTTWTQNIVVRLLWEIANGDTITNTNLPLPEDWHLSHSAPFYEVDQYWRRRRSRSQQDSNTSSQSKEKAKGKLKSSTSNSSHEEVGKPMERLPAETPIRVRVCATTGEVEGNRDYEYRVFNTHLLPHQLPDRAKCVYVVRDPLDVMISFYHHLSNQAVEDGGYTGTFDEFFEEFLNGTIVYGKWQDHIEAWLGQGNGNRNRNKNHQGSFLVLHYEDMKRDLAKETKRLAQFLLEDERVVSHEQQEQKPKREDAARNRDEDRYLDEIVSRVVPHCTFEAMRRERKRYTPLTVSWNTNPETGKPYDEFVRTGTVGDGRKTLLDTTSSDALKGRWIDRDVPIAAARWANAGVEQEIIDRYLPL